MLRARPVVVGALAAAYRLPSASSRPYRRDSDDDDDSDSDSDSDDDDDSHRHRTSSTSTSRSSSTSLSVTGSASQSQASAVKATSSAGAISSSSHGLSKGAAAGIIVTILLVIALLALLYHLRRRTRKRLEDWKTRSLYLNLRPTPDPFGSVRSHHSKSSSTSYAFSTLSQSLTLSTLQKHKPMPDEPHSPVDDLGHKALPPDPSREGAQTHTYAAVPRETRTPSPAPTLPNPYDQSSHLITQPSTYQSLYTSPTQTHNQNTAYPFFTTSASPEANSSSSASSDTPLVVVDSDNTEANTAGASGHGRRMSQLHEDMSRRQKQLEAEVAHGLRTEPPPRYGQDP